MIYSFAGSATGGQQAQVPAGSWLCGFRLGQTPLWPLFFNLEIRYSNSCPVRFLGQTILWAPVCFGQPLGVGGQGAWFLPALSPSLSLLSTLRRALA